MKNNLLLTVAQHLPLFGGFIGLGANGFYYQQLSGDTGSGARLGDFEGRTAGVGPVLSYVRQFGKTQLLAEVKWLPELDTDKRMEGDYLWFKFGFLFSDAMKPMNILTALSLALGAALAPAGTPIHDPGKGRMNNATSFARS